MFKNIANFNNTHDYLLKYASLKNTYKNFDFVLSLNEVMAGLIYNRIFKLYAPELLLVWKELQPDNVFMIASKFDNKIGEAIKGAIKGANMETNLHNDIEKGFYADCIMANWDIFININTPGANMFSTDKNINNKSPLSNRILRLDVGGTMSIRAQGAEKISFINKIVPLNNFIIL